MGSYRISKYNPELRDEHGAYQQDEWTSVCDIGKHFAAGTLTIKDYLAVESCYIDAVLYLWQLAEHQALCVIGLETNTLKNNPTHLANLPALREIVTAAMPVENQELPGLTALTKIVSQILREFIWCKLESKSGLYFHFGRDYYIYCGGVELSENNRCAIEGIGLFVEDCSSPYSD